MNEATKTFKYGDVKIKYCETGVGDPLILLHGLGASSYSWNEISKPLSRKNRLILIDLKGFGLSDKPLDDKYSIADQAEIILDFIKKNDLRNLVLAGHSLGGTIALFTALKLIKEKDNPIKKLVLIDSPAYKQKLPEFTVLTKIPIINKLLFSLLPLHFQVKMVLKRCFFDDKKITEEIIENYSKPLRLAGSYHALVETAKELIPPDAEEITKHYREINVPALLIWGQYDKVIPLEIGRRLQKDIPNSKLIVIPDCGHMPPEEKPAETAKIISDFLNNI
jgi:pimeloyl-ACP methyl ester carboxylesterase